MQHFVIRAAAEVILTGSAALDKNGAATDAESKAVSYNQDKPDPFCLLILFGCIVYSMIDNRINNATNERVPIAYC